MFTYSMIIVARELEKLTALLVHKIHKYIDIKLCVWYRPLNIVKNLV